MILSRYLFREVLLTVLVVLLVILGLDFIAGVADELERLNDDYRFINALEYVLLSMPGKVTQVLPFAVLIGCLASLGAMAGNSELVVMRSSGVSIYRIVAIVSVPILLLSIAGLFISEVIAPVTDMRAKSDRAILSKRLDTTERTGFWHREGDNFYYISAVTPENRLVGIIGYQFSGQVLEESWQADFADYIAPATITTNTIESLAREHSVWSLVNVKASRFNPQLDNIIVELRPEMNWQTGLNPALLETLVMEPKQMALQDLWQYAFYLSSQQLDSGKYLLAFWQKALLPLTMLSLFFVAVGFILGPLRDATMGFKIFIGVMVGIGFRTLQQILGPACLVYGLNPVFAVLVPVILSVMFGWYSLNKMR